MITAKKWIAPIVIVGLFQIASIEASETPILPTPEPDEFSLLPILDELYGLENLTRVDDAADQIWVNLLGSSLVTGKALFAGDTAKVFGYLRESPSDRPLPEVPIPIVNFDGFGFDILPTVGTLPTVQDLPVFRWLLVDDGWSSWPDDNAVFGKTDDCSDHMVTWRIDGTNSYVLAWEDQPIPISDQDFNDLVVQVDEVEPVKPVVSNQYFDLLSTRVIYEPTPTSTSLFIIAATFRFKGFETRPGALDPPPVAVLPFFKVVELSGNNLLVNADSCERGVGATLNPWVGGRDVLVPNQTFDVAFQIDLADDKPFEFFVDILMVFFNHELEVEVSQDDNEAAPLFERNHQGVGNQLLDPLGKVGSANDPIQCRQRFGGMFNFYYREAA